MRTVDASVLVSAWLPTDVNHAASRAWLLRHAASGQATILPTLALTEVAGGLCRRTGDRAGARRTLRHLMALPGVLVVGLDRRLMWRAALLASTVGLRGSDAVYAAIAHREAAPLVTWDADQRRRAGVVVVAHTPLTDPF